ncbi:hypothetical protein [Calidifontibacillus oryziterrae]|uniref:hypothetical protein n=1 Tax=Calidifontibacillus oryziterrae TaxID=1191699 RepID=UPI000305CA62|nr:hypothetical protein [Calidifontibacillus oryziterrae]
MEADEAVKIINNLDEKPGGTLRFYGEWFGRPYDNYHKILECSFNDGILIIKFDAGELIKIWNPNKIIFNHKELTIKESICVEFIRYYYGKPQTSENLIIDRYSNGEISNTSIKVGKVNDKIINRSYPAVELL